MWGGRKPFVYPFFNPFKRTRSEQPFRRDVPIFNVGEECRLDPRRLGLFYRLRQFRFRAYHRFELFADLAGNGARPACPTLPM
jgi:hypothetical protein